MQPWPDKGGQPDHEGCVNLYIPQHTVVHAGFHAQYRPCMLPASSSHQQVESAEWPAVNHAFPSAIVNCFLLQQVQD